MRSPGFSLPTTSAGVSDSSSAPRRSQTGQAPAGVSPPNVAQHSGHVRVAGIGNSGYAQYSQAPGFWSIRLFASPMIQEGRVILAIIRRDACFFPVVINTFIDLHEVARSEERRVGKEC